MRKCLYMVCPTDQLESAINARFEGHNYFYTTLGNTLILDKNTVGQIAALLDKNSIREITFILSEDNCIVLDALKNQHFLTINGLNGPYAHLQKHKKHVLSSWDAEHQHTLILSHHLNQKIKELKAGLQGLLTTPPLINGKLFSVHTKDFRPIHSDLVCMYSGNLS